MSAENGLGIPVVEAPFNAGGDHNARAILGEIAGLLERLLAHDEAGSIDLGSLPLTDEDYDLLQESLGEGEVVAEVEAMGLTRAQESGFPGVWWVIHYNSEGDVVAQFIEVAYCPEILITPVEDVQEGLEALRAQLFDTERKKRGNHHAR